MTKTFDSCYADITYGYWCEMLDKVEFQLLAEDDQWWNDLDPEEQEKYLRNHPDSAKAKEVRAKQGGETEPSPEEEPPKEVPLATTKQVFADLKNHVKSVADSVKLDVATVTKAFKEPSVYNTVKALGGSISAASKTVQGAMRGVGKTLDVGGALITDTPGFKQLEQGLIKADEVLSKYPVLNRLPGAAVAGIAAYQWLNMSFSGDVESDYDVSLIYDGLAGKVGFEDLINTPAGVKSMGLLGAGLATGGLPIWMGGAVGLGLALTYSGLKKFGDTENGKKVKEKMVDLASKAGGVIDRGARAVDKKIGVKSEGFSNYYSGIQEKDEHKKSQQYKKLSPKMKDAVDQIFGIMDDKPSDFLNTFEKTIKDVSRKFKVPEKKVMNYFEKEMLTI